MESFGIYATMKAREGKEREVETLLASLQALAESEQGTKRWFAMRGRDRMYAIFDTFDDWGSRETHMNGEIPKRLESRAPDLFEGGAVALVFLDVAAEG